MVTPIVHVQGVPLRRYDWADAVVLAEKLAGRYLDLYGQPPNLVVGLETGGSFTAGLLKNIMGAEHMITLDVESSGGEYRLGGLAKLQDLKGAVVFGVDDGFRRGELFRQLDQAIQDAHGVPRLGALVRIDWFKPNEEHRRPSEKLLGRIIYVETIIDAPGADWPWKPKRLR